MRETRPKHSELSEEERRKANTRSYTNVLVRRGELVRGPCKFCGSTENIQAHHLNYKNPRNVIWVCKDCHPKHCHPDNRYKRRPRFELVESPMEDGDEAITEENL